MSTVQLRSPRRLLTLAVLLLATAIASPTLDAQVSFAAPFQDHMVLQRDRPLHVFGTAPAGSEVSVQVAGRRGTATASADGRFLTVLAPLSGGGPYVLRASCSDGSETRCEDVLAGEVWIASGQSNMEWPLDRFPENAADIAAGADAKLRLLRVARRASGIEVDTIDGSWQLAGPDTLPKFSAVAYYFARDLRRHLGVPIGIVQSAWGGTRAEAWTRRVAMEPDPTLRPILERWDELDASHPERLAAWQIAVAKWEAQRAAGEQVGRKPGAPVGPQDRHHPSTLYNGMIAPLAPMTVAGFLWYQGESNASRGWQYRRLLGAMIEDWRRVFRQGDLPFHQVQLAAFRPGGSDGQLWADVRESQQVLVGDLPHVGLATAIDIGNPTNIHPPHKDEVGRRLALWARAQSYGQAVVPSGPIYRSCRIEGDRVRLSFDHCGGGLQTHGEAGLTGFTIAAEGGEFVAAEAHIEGDTVVVHSAAVPHPAAVRYAWADDPQLSLFGGTGLPALPLRTDARKLPTQGQLRP